MGERIFSWYASASSALRNWFFDLADRSGCRLAEKKASGDDRCVVINQHCENQQCENITLGRYGSPGRVENAEKLYRILIAPVDIDMSAEQIIITAITHSETIGMSVLRDRATDDEFRTIVDERTSRGARSFVAVAELDCEALRSFRSEKQEAGRQIGDRHLIVTDTDMRGLPHHADVFKTIPRKSGDPSPTNKAVWRRERSKLLSFANANIVKRHDFREGRI